MKPCQVRMTTEIDELQEDLDQLVKVANDTDRPESVRLRATILALKTELSILELNGQENEIDSFREFISQREEFLESYEAASKKAKAAATLAAKEAYAAEMTNAFMSLPDKIKESSVVSLTDTGEWEFLVGY